MLPAYLEPQQHRVLPPCIAANWQQNVGEVVCIDILDGRGKTEMFFKAFKAFIIKQFLNLNDRKSLVTGWENQSSNR